ncbi:MAG: hypothetical protein JXA82_08865 [Sedimentisphaerales bacterium]|nr:hypothetical protein [Sedimentisphaerales bacterium]
MSNQIKVFLAVYAALVMLAATAPTYAVVIGDWEGSPDGWIDWGEDLSIDDPNLMPGKYDYDTVGATLGGQSLKLTDLGWGQTLSIKLNAAQRADFMASSLFSIDYSVAADTLGVGGFARIQGIAFNADGLSWTEFDLSDTENFWFWDGSPEQTQTLVFDYSDLKDSINPDPGYVEIILTTNGRRDPDPYTSYDMYFDNAQLTVVQSYNELVIEDEPVLYLRFETTPMVDSSAETHWVYQGSGAAISKYAGIGNAVHLNGLSSGVVASSVLDSGISWGGVYGDEYAFAPDDITFEFWAKIEAISQYGMFFQQIGPWTREDFAPGLGQAGPEANAFGALRILNGTEDANDMDFWYPPDSNTPGDGQWHYYAITYDEQFGGDPNLMQIQFYLDGALKGSTIVGGTAGLPAKLGPEQDHLCIGGEQNRGYVYNTVTGFIDEFAIYAGVLPGDRVAAHYAQGRLEVEPQNCAEVFLREQGLAADIDQDCDVDLADFASIASTWLICNDPALFETEPDRCFETW